MTDTPPPADDAARARARRELDKQLAALDARPADLPEGGVEPPRGALPGLFRGLREVEAARADGLARLAARLPDLPLLEPTLALAREVGGEAALVAGWTAQAAAADAWCAARQVAALAAACGGQGEARRAVEVVAALAGDAAWDPTDAALAVGVEALARALREVVRLRLASPARRRDRTSARLAAGAVGALARLAPGDAEVAGLLAQVVAAETRRAGKDEPTLALAALDGLARAPALERLRLLAPLLRGVDRPKVAAAVEAAVEAAAAEVGAGPEDRADLLARAGGLEPDGWARVPLDEGGEVRLRPAADGALEQVLAAAPAGPSAPPAAATPTAATPLAAAPRLAPGDARAVEAAARELAQAREDLVRRLEAALVSGRAWSVRLWRATFLGGHPLWRDLAPRLLWELRPAGGPPRAFELGPGGPEDVLGDPVDLDAAGEGARVGLAHPTRLERGELELWRERALERVTTPAAAAAASDPRRPEPLLQRFRPVAGAPEDVPALAARFVGRQAHKQAVGELARRSGWSGVPLLGTGPWTLTRALPGAQARLALEDAPVEVVKLTPARKAALTGERALDEDEVFGPSRDPKARGRRPPPEAAPRVRLAGVELAPGPGEPDLRVARAELAYDLEVLTDGLVTVDELFLRTLQHRKWADEKAAWREVVLRYRVASAAAVDARRAVLAALAKAEGLAVRLEDRFAITGQHVVELGTGLVHHGPAKDHLPRWKVDELLAGRGDPPPALPFEPQADPAAAEVVARVLGLARLARGQAPPGG